MKIYNNINEIREKKCFVTVGVFDGLHLGHQHILKTLKESARTHNVESAVITFHPHPLTVVGKNISVSLIDTLKEKVQLIEQFGIDNLIIQPFTKEFASLSAKDFMRKYLKNILDIEGLIVGYDHKFGKDKLHDFNTLSHYAEELNFKIIKTDAFVYDESTISSTLIRESLLNGKVEQAKKFLSRPYNLSGEVVKGRQIGRQIGFPTANIMVDFPNKIIPQEGVYAVEVEHNNTLRQGMMNIGKRPTFSDGIPTKTIEVYIFNFDGDLYGETLKVSFHKRIRNEINFASVEDLISQLKEDEKNIRQYFNINHKKKDKQFQLQIC